MAMLSTPPTTDDLDTLRNHPDMQPLIAGWYAGTVGRREFLTRATAVLSSLAAATTLLAACGGSVQTNTSVPSTATVAGATPSRAAAATGPTTAPSTSGSAAASPATSGSAAASPATSGSAAAATRPATSGSAAAAPATAVPATAAATAPITSGSAAAATGTRPATSGSAPAGSASPAAAAVATGVPEADVDAKMVQFKSGTADIIAYEARPKNATGTLPAVIVIHENMGLTDHIKDVTRRVAKEGFIGLGVDFLSRSGGTMSFNTPQDVTAANNKLTDEQTIADSSAAIQYLKSNGATKVGVVGFCWGGRRSMVDAENTAVNAAVVYYGPISTPDMVQTKDTLADAPKDMCPVLGNFGGMDPIIPAAKIQQLADALKAAGQTVDFKIYPEAGHAFNNDTRPFTGNIGYVASAATDAWGRTIAWFKKYLA